MNHNAFRWIIVALLSLSLLFTLSCPYVADAEGAALPLDFLQGGMPTDPDGWVFEDKYPVSYEDSTIRVTFEHGSYPHVLSSGNHQGEKAKRGDEYWLVRISIQDVSQLRTAASYDRYTKKDQAEADAMATSKNAVVAMNGDFFKYENDVGYVVRQGELIRDATGNKRGRIFDMLLIDSEGDFHAVYAADTEKINAYVEENLTPQGRTVLDTFNIGPVLIQDGEIQDVSVSQAALSGQYQWKYPMQRVAIVQTGHLEYAIVSVGTQSGVTGLNVMEFAEFVMEKCPDAQFAYNLDGGGSVNIAAPRKIKTKKDGSVVIQCERINTNNDIRPITDILYFASAEDRGN